MEHEEAEEGSGNGSKISMGRSDAASNSAVTKLQALRLAEDLSLPSVQVVVMSANMGCSHCRQRVTKVVSKMNGLLDYMVDFGKKEVTVRGAVHTKRKKGRLGRKGQSLPRTRTLSWFLGCYGSSAPS